MIVILQTILTQFGSEDTTTDLIAFDGSGKTGDLQRLDGTILAHTSALQMQVQYLTLAACSHGDGSSGNEHSFIR